MKRTASLLAATVLAATIVDARADVSATVTLASDYDFRGITQTALDPALSASLDWSGDSGLYVGTWASNVDFGPGTSADIEVDLYGGFRGNFNDDTTFDIGAAYYTYWSDEDEFEYAEFYAGIGYKAVSAKLWYAPDFGNTGESASYLEANASIPLPADFSLTLHAGYSDGDYWDVVNDGGYFDYSLGVAKTFGKFAVGLKWIDGSDLESADGTPGDVFTSESKVYLSIATTFPW